MPDTSLPIRVLLVESQQLVRRAMRRALEWEPDIVVIAEATDRDNALSTATQAQPDVAVVSRHVGGSDGIEIVEALRDRVPNCQVIVAAAEEDIDDLLAAIEVGARAFLTGEASPERFGDAVRTVHRGDLMIADHLISPLLNRLATQKEERAKAMRRLAPLTPRERTVLALLVRGASSQRIGEILSISPETARTHVQHILDKLGVHSRLEAVAYVTRNRMVMDMLNRELGDQGVEA